ncbi:hypothetical protein KKA69_02755, partial [Patescibacteria group bacterium]|nr:hypothetical protein [Patescibacteria group bacterium]
KNIILFFISILGSLFDWTFLIFLFSFLMVYKDKRAIKYLLASFTSLFLFFIYASILVGFNDLTTAYLTRSLGSELFNFKFPLLRLLTLSLVRIIIYFSPLALFLSILYPFKEKVKKPVLVFLIFGSLNIVLFLNGAFAHPYWLYFLSPFFILTSSRMLIILSEKKKVFLKFVFVFALLVNFCFCFLVINFKDKQVKKALWQDDFINKITPLVHENGIGVNWDFNEELFRYKTGLPIKIYWSREEIFSDVSENKWQYFVFSCWANCSQKDQEIGRFLSQKYESIYSEKEGRAFLFDLEKPKKEASSASSPNLSSDIPPANRLIFLYRKLRDLLSVNQI